MRIVETVRLPGLTPYAPMLQKQRERREAIARSEAANTLYLLEHNPVFTCGRDFHQENLLLAPELLKARGIDVAQTDRGGDVTYHGPGQLVAYPLLNLNEWQCSVGWYLRTLEQVIIDLLAEWNVESYRVESLTGVWVAGAKVAAVGVGIHRWITFHGVAINVHPNLDHFGLIIPCGISDKPVTSLERLLPDCPTMDEVATRFENHFRRVFDCTPS